MDKKEVTSAVMVTKDEVLKWAAPVLLGLLVYVFTATKEEVSGRLIEVEAELKAIRKIAGSMTLLDYRIQRVETRLEKVEAEK